MVPRGGGAKGVQCTLYMPLVLQMLYGINPNCIGAGEVYSVEFSRNIVNFNSGKIITKDMPLQINQMYNILKFIRFHLVIRLA